MFFPHSSCCIEKTKILRDKSWKVAKATDCPLIHLFHKRLSFEGQAPETKQVDNAIFENLKEKVQLPSKNDYDQKKLIKEQLKIISSTVSDSSLIQFANFLANKENGLQKLGMLLFAIDHMKDSLEESLLRKNWDKTETWLDESFAYEVSKIDEALNETLEKNRKINIQSTSIIKSNLIPREIAKFVISNLGCINIGLLEYVKEAIAKDQKNYISHDLSLYQTINLFLNHKTIRNQLSRVKAPLNPNSPACTVIRASMGLKSSDPITHVHAKRSVMTALLSHLRQQEKRSCFATFLAINMKQSHLKHCIEDFISLLQYSHLTREDKGIQEHFPFLLKMSNLDLNNEFMIDTQYLGDSAGLLAACSIMGVENPQEILTIIASKIENPATPKKIIEMLAKHVAKESNQKYMTAKLYQQGCFAFGSMTFNPLLKVWVNAIAGMGESEANSFFGSCIIKTVLTIFHKHLVAKKLFIDSIEEFEKHLYHHLSNSIQLIYDPSIGTPKDAGEGGFVLYEGVEKDEIRRLKRIDNSNDFHDFLNRTLEKCTEENSLVKSLQTFCNSPLFIEQILITYNEILSYHLDKIEQKTFSTPWVNHLGHDASDIMRVYLDQSSELRTIQFIPRNAKKLLRNFILMGKRLDKKEKKKLKNNPYLLKPARITNYHAFSLMIGHSSMQKAWRDKRLSKKWIEEEILIPGQEISNSIITEIQRDQLIKKFNLDDIPGNVTIKQFRKLLLKKLYPLSTETKLKIDQMIVKTLPKNLKEKVQKTIIHFADTNLHCGIHDVHFCFIVNPGTGHIEVWQATDDNSQLTALDQNLVVKDRKWEIYLYPDELIT